MAACVSSAPTPSAGSATEAEESADTVHFGGCAPLRYREIEPGDVVLETRLVREPPAPVSFTVRPLAPRQSHRALSQSVAVQLRAAKGELIRCVDEEVDENRKAITLILAVQRHAMRIISIRGIRDSKRRSCVKTVLSSKLKLRRGSTVPGNLRFEIAMRARKSSAPPPEVRRRRGTVEILSSSDRAEEGLALSARVIGRRAELVSCLARNKQRGVGSALASLRVVGKEINMASVDVTDSAAPRLSECFAAVLSGLSTPAIGDGGFQCAISFGPETKRPVPLVLQVDERGLRTADSHVEIDDGRKAPLSALYRELLALRFADARPSPAPAVLQIEPGVGGTSIIAVAEAALAADIEIAMVRVASKTDEELALDPAPVPVLGRYAARAAGLTAIVGSDTAWIGSTNDEATLPVPLANPLAIASALKAIATIPGIAGREDATVGIEAEASAAQLDVVLKALETLGIERIQLTSAENARARLAR